MKKMKFWLLIGALSALLVACGGEDEKAETDKAANDAEKTKSTDAGKETGSTGETSSVSEGEKVAKSSCIGCHGVDLTGGMGPDLTNLSLSKEEVVDVLIKGKGSMPPGSANGAEEAVADYILSLK